MDAGYFVLAGFLSGVLCMLLALIPLLRGTLLYKTFEDWGGDPHLYLEVHGSVERLLKKKYVLFKVAPRKLHGI